jgi:hypothetical protein
VIELEPFADAHLPGIEALVADEDILRYTHDTELWSRLSTD